MTNYHPQQHQTFNQSWYCSYENSNDSYIPENNSATEYCNSAINEYNNTYPPPYPSQVIPDACQLQSQNSSNQFLSSSWPSTNSPTLSCSSSNERCSPASNESRRGRPLISDSVEESEKAKKNRNYARKYREMLRSKKTKLEEENDQLRNLIQRFLYLHSILPQNVETEIQRLKTEFQNLNGSNTDKLKNCNIFTCS